MPWLWERWTGEPKPDLAAEVAGLVVDVTRDDGIKPLSDAMVLTPPDDARRVLVRTDAGTPIGYAITAPEDALAEFLVLPSARRQGLGEALAAASARDGARQWWAHGNLPGAQALAARHGLVTERELLLLVRTGGPPSAEIPPGFRIRPLQRDGSDDAALLAVNSAAFADLPDQGGWGPEDLRARTSAPWFDHDDVLLMVADAPGPGDTRLSDGYLAGFHWTKRHPTGECEVYVIGLDPHWQGRALGAPLLAAGLQHLAAKGCGEVGLFVDAGNQAALRLYRRLGFDTARTDVLYRRG